MDLSILHRLRMLNDIRAILDLPPITMEEYLNAIKIKTNIPELKDLLIPEDENEPNN